MTVEEAINNSGTKNILAKGSTKKIQQMMQPNEELIYALNTNVCTSYNKDVFSMKNKLNGVLAITDKRIIFCNSILGSTNQKQIQIKDITSIEEHINGLTKMGQIIIKGITETFLVDIYKARLADEIKESIYKAQNVNR